MPEYDDDTLEQIMREGLAVRAAGARDRLEDEPGSRAVRRRRGPWLVAAAAVAVLVVAGGVTAALRDHPADGTAVDHPSPGDIPAGWRYESFDGVQVRVPPSWGWGGTPTGSGDRLTSCGASVATVPQIDGAVMQAGVPFVGRPVMMSDACQNIDVAHAVPATQAVWLGSPLPTGTHTVGSATAQTVAVGGQHVTVFGDDAALREAILSTVEAVDTDGNGCPTEPVRRPAAGPADAEPPTALSVCAYDDGRLLWSGLAGAQQAQDYVDAFDRASSVYDAASLCSDEPVGQWVAIGVDTGVAGAQRWDIANFGCPALVGRYVYGTEGKESPMEAPLIADTVAPWALGGIQAYVAGPVDGSSGLGDYFRGMLG